jgi:hypothetical protein
MQGESCAVLRVREGSCRTDAILRCRNPAINSFLHNLAAVDAVGDASPGVANPRLRTCNMLGIRCL